jgi:hypothetical protein
VEDTLTQDAKMLPLFRKMAAYADAAVAEENPFAKRD